VHRLPRHACEAEHLVEGLLESSDRHIRAILDVAGALNQSVHQEASRVIEHRRAVASAAVVKAYDDP
jgi:hypothetical protein